NGKTWIDHNAGSSVNEKMIRILYRHIIYPSQEEAPAMPHSFGISIKYE
ncbi:unnamed protein product, partial [marine sediment metagenome]